MMLPIICLIIGVLLFLIGGFFNKPMVYFVSLIVLGVTGIMVVV